MNLFKVTKKQSIEGYELRTMTGDIVSFTPSYSQLLPDPFSDLNVTVNIEATGGNGTPDSPNPIVGYTEANITRCGVNLFDKSQLIEGKFYNIVDGNVVEQSNANKAHLPLLKVKPSTTYYMSGFASNSYYTIIALDTEKNPITYYGGASKTEPFIATLPNNCEFVYLNINTKLADTTIFCESNTSIPYTPYNGQIYAISFGQTVYGGVFDVTRGKLTVTHKILDLGDFGWVNENNEQTGLCRANAQFTDCVWNTLMICSAYNYNSTTAYNGLSDGDIALTNSESIPLLRIRNTDYSTYTNAQIKTAVTGVKLVYQTKTPFDIDLTPEVISAIVGTNNVFAGCGDVTVKCLI